MQLKGQEILGGIEKHIEFNSVAAINESLSVDVLIWRLKLNSKINVEKHLETLNKNEILGYHFSSRALVLKNSYRTRNWIQNNISVLTHIDYSSRKPRAESHLSLMDFSVNQINLMKYHYPFLSGFMENVFIKENLPNEDDIDLFGKINKTELSSDSRDIHASDMSTIIGGLGNTFYTSRGIAPAVAFRYSDFNNLLPDPAISSSGISMKIQNHSYGIGIEDYYGIEAQAYDDQAFNNSEILHVFSAGNKGEESGIASQYKGLIGFSNLTGTFKMAKNVLTIGAVDSFARVLPSSSRGPAYDGRIKPELVAFGLDGSSGAAAITSGTATLIREAIIENGDTPHSHLIKALLINGATDVFTKGPDYQSGYGNVNGYQSVKSAVEKNYIIGIKSREDYLYSMDIPANVASLKATLVWNDPPAEINNQKAVVRDLDFIIHHGENTYLPFILSSIPDPQFLSLPATTGTDTLNNIEVIEIQNPQAGKYTLSVSAVDSIVDFPFSIVYHLEEKNTFRWNFPIEGDVLISSQKNILRWEHNFEENKLSLFYKRRNDSIWQIIDRKGRNEACYLPDFIEGDIIDFLAVANGDSIFNNNILVSAIPQLNLVNSCDEYLTFQVNNAEMADSFSFLNFQEGKMETLFKTSAPTFNNQEKDLPSNYYAIIPHYKDRKGLQSIAILISNQAGNCYIDLFTASINLEKVELSLNLSSTFQINSIVIEKLKPGGFQEYKIITPAETLLYFAVDETPDKGKNTYRVKIILETGEIIFSEIANVFFIEPNSYFVSPTILSNNQELFIQQNNFKLAKIYIYNSMGYLMQVDELLSPNEYIELTGYPSGTYLYMIKEDENKAPVSGRFIIANK